MEKVQSFKERCKHIKTSLLFKNNILFLVRLPAYVVHLFFVKMLLMLLLCISFDSFTELCFNLLHLF